MQYALPLSFYVHRSPSRRLAVSYAVDMIIYPVFGSHPLLDDLLWRIDLDRHLAPSTDVDSSILHHH